MYKQEWMGPMKSICTFVRFAEIGMHVEQARSRMLMGSMAGHARLPSTCMYGGGNWGQLH